MHSVRYVKIMEFYDHRCARRTVGNRGGGARCTTPVKFWEDVHLQFTALLA